MAQSIEQLKEFLAANIRTRRKSLKLTQSELAEAIERSLGMVQEIEYKKTWPGPETICALAKALECEPWELLAPPCSPENLRTVAEPTAPYETTPTPSAKEIADLILAYGNAESSLRASIRRQLGLEKSDQDREAFERHALSYREQRDKLQIKDRKGE